MHKQARRLSTLASASLVAGAFALPAAPALAVPAATEVTVFASDTNGDGNHGLYTRTSPTATPVALVAESDSLDITEVATSADGTRIVTVEDTYPATGDSHERVVVRDLSGRLDRVVADVDTDASPTYVFAASLSPDGTTAVWSQVSLSGPVGSSAFTLRRAPVAGGAATTIPGSSGLVGAVFLDATTLLANQFSGTAATLPLAGGTATAVTGLTGDDHDFAISPDGSKLAWSRDTTPSGSTTDTADLLEAPLSVTNGAATVGGSQTLATGLDNLAPAWTADGARVRFVQDDGKGGNGDIWIAPLTGTASAESPTPSADEVDVATGVDDNVGPAAATALPFTLGTSAATLAWTLPSDADLAGVVVTRSPAAVPIFVPGPVDHLTVGGLPVGSTFTYTFTAVDRAGNTATAVPAATRSLTAVRAGAAFSSPTSYRAATAPFSVVFGSAAAFTVDYSTNSGAFASWVVQQPGSKRPFGLPSSGAAATTSTPGSTYRFRVTAFDGHGNATAPVVSGPAVVPYDQTLAGYSKGSYTYVSKDRWLGSVAVLPFGGATAKSTFTGNQLQLVGDRCPSCGVLDVYVNGVRVGAAETYARTRAIRSVLFTITFPSTAARTIAVRARGTAHRPAIVLDGFAVRR